jgi:hypothetical protein
LGQNTGTTGVTDHLGRLEDDSDAPDDLSDERKDNSWILD